MSAFWTQSSSSQTSTYTIDLSKRLTCNPKTKKNCEYPSTLSNNARTVVVAVVVPVGIVIIILSFFFYKNWRKNKEEAFDDDDPNFNGENTILPDEGFYGGAYEAKVLSNGSINPFDNGSSTDLKYPSNVYTNLPKGVSPYSQSTFFNNENMSSINTIAPGRYMDSFILPSGEQTDSKKSLDQFARVLGNRYSAYALAESPNHSRNSSITKSVHPFARSTDALSKTNLSQVMSVDDHGCQNSSQNRSPTHSSSTDNSKDEMMDEKKIQITTTTDSADDDLEYEKHIVDSNPASNTELVSEQIYATSDPSISTANLVKSWHDDENNIDNRNSIASTRSENLILLDVNNNNSDEPHRYVSDEDDLDDPNLPAEEREKLRRLKSIYNVYFERENSVKHLRKENNEEVVLPPLPSLPNNISGQGANNVSPLSTEEEEEEGGNYHQEVAPDIEQSQNLTIETNFDRNYASSVYPENPLNDYEPYQQDMLLQQQHQQQQYQHQYQHQQHQQHQYQQQYPRQQPIQRYPNGAQHLRQLAYQQGAVYSSNIPKQPKGKPSLTKLAMLPTPSELNQRPFSSVNFYTDYEPKFAYKASSSPKTEIPQGFNPIDQWSTTDGSNSDQQQQQQQIRNITPTAISRTSVTMTNPTVISKYKLYKPAGSLAVAANEYAKTSPYVPQQQPQYFDQQSPISPTGGQQGMMMMMMPPTMSGNDLGTLTPRSGSKQDLRLELRQYMGNNTTL